MTTFEETLSNLQQQIEQLRAQTTAAPTDRYDEGWRACHQEITTQIREVLNNAIKRHLPTTAPTKQQAAKEKEPTPFTPPAASAKYVGELPPATAKPGSGKRVRQEAVIKYLAEHPGAKYNELKSALGGQFVMNALYDERMKTEVLAQDENGGFWLKSHLTGDPDDETRRNRD